jgi:hypothetical protein
MNISKTNTVYKKRADVLLNIWNYSSLTVLGFLLARTGFGGSSEGCDSKGSGILDTMSFKKSNWSTVSIVFFLDTLVSILCVCVYCSIFTNELLINALHYEYEILDKLDLLKIA